MFLESGEQGSELAGLRLLILVGEVLAAQEQADIVAVEMVVWLDVVNGPVLILVA